MAPLKSSLAKSATKLFGVFRDRDLSLRGIVSDSRVDLPGMTVSGGNAANGLAPGNGYKYHTFTTPGTLSISGTVEALEVLMVAGGGGGGAANSPSGTDGGAGGGAGGLIYVPGYEFSPGDHPITIGSGGSGAPLPSTPGGPDIASQKGGNTTWGNLLTAVGGGGGGSGPSGGPADTQGPFGSGGGQGGGGSGPHPTAHKGVLEINQEHHKIFLHLVISNLVILEEPEITQHPMLVVAVVVLVVMVDQVMAMVIVETVV